MHSNLTNALRHNHYKIILINKPAIISLIEICIKSFSTVPEMKLDTYTRGSLSTENV
jgi:hypothetical protein